MTFFRSTLTTIGKILNRLFLLELLVGAIAVAGLLLTLHGNVDDGLMYQNGYDSSVGSPFELTNTTSRYVLTQAIVDNKRFSLSDEQAKAASPDLVKHEDVYMSIFTPGVSLYAAPFYWLGQQRGVPQLYAFLSTAVIGFCNVYLIALLSRRIGAEKLPSYVGGLIFLFATNALIYAHTLTQHHLSSFLLMLALFITSRQRSLLNNLALGMVYGAGLLVDIPNAFLILPAVMTLLFRHIETKVSDQKLSLRLHFVGLGMLIGLLPFIAFFGYYNHSLTGSYTTIGQFIGRYNYPDPNHPAPPKVEDTYDGPKDLQLAPVPFDTRDQLRGLSVLLLGKERSYFYYSPVVMVGIIGLVVAFKKKKTQPLATLIIASIAFNILIYASFGDPWGGWTFGPRYLIPTAALLSTGIGVALTYARSRLLLAIGMFIFTVSLLLTSVQQTMLGAFTTAAIPPRHEAEALLNDTPWTTTYNERILARNQINSLYYNMYLRDEMLPTVFVQQVTTATIALLGSATALSVFWPRRKEEEQA